MFDEQLCKRIRTKDVTLQLEHSLVSVSKWESKWKVHYINNDKLTEEMSIDYVRCMTVSQNVDPKVYLRLTQENMKEIMEYINDPMTATTFRKTMQNQRQSQSIITAEIIYYWMTTLGIPFDPCQKWHLNRLLTLIRVCDEKSAPRKKMGKREEAAQRRSLNAARRARMHSRG
jgi:hypothetical protein